MDYLKNFIKKFISQEFINNFYHMPRAFLANLIYGFPTRNLKVIGVTGTDGKTTATNMIYHILKEAGKKVSMISTINAVIAGKEYDTGFHVTSPDPFTIQKFAGQALDHGDEYLVLEVTSHAIDQYRVWGINFEAGIITNITHEHLDYHKTFENYSETKLNLLKNARFGIVNQAIKGGSGRLITFGFEKGDFNQKNIKLKLNLPGDYNIENALAAIAATSVLGIDQKRAKRSVENFKGLSGRMEEIENDKGIKVIVDFAHTPNALKNILQTLRKQTNGKLTAVFGAAGKRDASKRPLMGKVAATLSDFVIITAEDPRGESIDSISSQIAKGVEKAGKFEGKDYWMVNDRKEAISFAIKNAKKGDAVGIFGKGHEKSMNLDGIHEVSWSDVEAAKDILYGR